MGVPITLLVVAVLASGGLFAFLAWRDRQAISFASSVVSENSPIAELATRKIVWKVVHIGSTISTDTVRETVYTIKAGYDLSQAETPVVDKEAKASGRQSLRFELSASGKRECPQARAFRTIKVKPNHRYRVTARLRTEGLDTTYGFQIVVYTRPGKGEATGMTRQLTSNRPRIQPSLSRIVVRPGRALLAGRREGRGAGGGQAFAPPGMSADGT